MLILLLAAGHAGACEYQSSGDTIAAVDHADYEFELAREDGSKTLCLLLRSPEQTSGVCEDGTDTAYFYARSVEDGPVDLLVFDNRVWYACD